MELTFNIPCDSEGYVAFECPFCEIEFKLLGADFQKEEYTYEDLFCPYCGLADKRDAFYTKEQAVHVRELCQNINTKIIFAMSQGKESLIFKRKKRQEMQ